MIRNALIAAAALTAATAASAEPKPEASDTAAVASTTTAVAPSKRYCVVATPTGSRLERRECKSLDAWLADGFDPRAKK